MSVRSLLRRVALLSCITGCALHQPAPAFDSRFPEANRQGAERVLLQLSRVTAGKREAQPLAVVITQAAEPELLAYDLAQGRVRWRKKLRASTRPEVLGDLVLTTAEGHLLGFSAENGAQRFRIELNACLYMGSAHHENRVFFVCSDQAAPAKRSSLTALDADSGRILWQHSAEGALGRPAAQGSLVLVPWQRQNLAVLDAQSGRELLRIQTRNDVIDWIRADKGGVLFGHQSLRRLNAQSAVPGGIPAQAPLLRSEDLPGRPAIMESAFNPQPAADSATGRVALHLLPETSSKGGLGVANDRYYLVFFRHIFAYDALGTLRWARMLDQDVVAGQAQSFGLALITEGGTTTLLGAEDGAITYQAELGTRIASAAFGGASPPPNQTLARVPGTLRSTLKAMALDTDSRLVPARAYAVRRLAIEQEPDITADLLDIYNQKNTPPELGAAVADALRTRRTGLDHLIEALHDRYDFLEQTRPAPLSVIVPALVEARETRAVPGLLERLVDHETPRAVVPIVARGIVELGDASVVQPLLAWLRLYRADSSVVQAPEAFIEVARGVLKHAGDEGQALLSSLLADGRVDSALASRIDALLRDARPKPPLVKQELLVVDIRPKLPSALSQPAIHATFAGQVDALRTCILAELGRNPRLAQVRVLFIAEHDGSAHALTFAPNTPAFVDCMYPSVASLRFPAFQAGRQVASYVIALRPVQETEPVTTRSAQKPWWQSRVRRTLKKESELGAPWWSSKQPIAPTILLLPRAEGVGPLPAKSAASSEDAWWAPVAPAPKAAPESTPASAPASPKSEDAWWLPAR